MYVSIIIISHPSQLATVLIILLMTAHISKGLPVWGPNSENRLLYIDGVYNTGTSPLLIIRGAVAQISSGKETILSLYSGEIILR